MVGKPASSGGAAGPVPGEETLACETRRQLREAVAAALAVADPEDLSPLEAQLEQDGASGPGPAAPLVPDEAEPGRELFDDAELAHRLGPELSLAALEAWAEATGFDEAAVLECTVRQTLGAISRSGEAVGLNPDGTSRWLTELPASAGSYGQAGPEALRALVGFFTAGPATPYEGPGASGGELLQACVALIAAAVHDAALRRRALAVDILAWVFPEAAADRPTTALQLLRLGLIQPGAPPIVPLPGVAQILAWRQIDRDESWRRFPDAPEQLRGRAMTAVVVEPVPLALRQDAPAMDAQPTLPTATVGVITYDNVGGSSNAYICLMVWDSMSPQGPAGDDRLLLVLDPERDQELLTTLVRDGVLTVTSPQAPGGMPSPAMVIPLPRGAMAEAVLAVAAELHVAPAA